MRKAPVTPVAHTLETKKLGRCLPLSAAREPLSRIGERHWKGSSMSGDPKRGLAPSDQVHRVRAREGWDVASETSPEESETSRSKSSGDLIPAEPNGWNPFGGGCTDPEEQKEYARLWAERNGNPRYERIALKVAERGAAEPFHVATIQSFAAIDEPGAEAFLGDADNALLPQGGKSMFYGLAGAGKTTLALDLALHLAAGDPWLGIPGPPRPLRVLLIENEGPRPRFRRKCQRKLEAWTGSALGDRITVLDAPWARFSFGPEADRQRLATFVREEGVDVVIAGPVTSSGMNEAGTLQEVRDFAALVDETRQLSGGHMSTILIHHENRAGQVSGAWEPAVDTLFHVQGQGHGRMRLYVEKARWASDYHATSLSLVWADGEGFAVEERDELDDETLGELIVAAIAAKPGTGWRKVEEATPGSNAQNRRAVRDGLFLAGRIVNVVKGDDGQLVALDHCQEAKAAHLYRADDPTISHLNPTSDAVGTQSESGRGRGIYCD